jgi:hypothetical protein
MPKADPDRWSTTDEVAGLFMLGLIYALVLGYLGWGFAGFGHGSMLFLDTCWPGLLLWPAAGAALAFAQRPVGRWVCPAIVMIQYILCLCLITTSDVADGYYLARTWSTQPWDVLTFTAVFLSGQAALWWRYVVKRGEAGKGLSRGRITIGGAMMAIVILSVLLAILTTAARLIID